MISSAESALHALNVGPVQVLLLSFKDPEMHGRIRAALAELLEHDQIRIIDRALVRRDADGTVTRIPAEDTDVEEVGAIVDSLIAVDEPTWLEEQAERYHAAIPEGAWFVSEKLPKGSAAIVLIIEHRWALPLQYAVIDAGGFHIADEWIHPVDVAALGLGDR
jgi:hypothetical protein